MRFFLFRNRIAAILGNLLEHYDCALFGFLTPFIAPLFFGEQKDPVLSLILTYGILPLGLLTRPLGSLCFGLIGDRFSRSSALFYSLLGMGITTIAIGFLPLYQDVGIWAPIFLSLGRMLQNFFSAGESTGSAIFVLEHTDMSKRSLVNGFYSALSLSGILMASGLVALASKYGSIEENWRYLFWIGGSTALLGVSLRWTSKDAPEFISAIKIKKEKWIYVLKECKESFLSIILASGFSHITYSLAFIFMNGYVPLITSLSKEEMIKINTPLLLIDMLLLPCFGYLAHRWGKEKIMLTAALCSVGAALPLFALLEGGSLIKVVFVRLAIIVPGVAFSASYHAWAIEKVLPQHRYLVLSLGNALGSQCIGMPTSFICLGLYRMFEWSFVPGFYLLFGALGASYALLSFGVKQSVKSP